MIYKSLIKKLFGANELYFAIRWFFLVITIGIIGFSSIEDYNLVEAIYMSMITISTVGFGEIHMLSDLGRIFTSLLILLSIGTYAYVISVFTRYAIQSEFYKKMKERKFVQEISKLEDHIIICGYGRNGRQAAETLKRHGKQFVIIDSNEDLVTELQNSGEFYAIVGDVTNDEILDNSNVKNASSLIAALPNDANNLFLVLSARQLNPTMKIISRATNDKTVNKLYVAGADNVIMPDKVGGTHMATLVVSPDLVEFIDNITVGNEKGITLEELSYHDIPEELKDKSIKELQLRESSGCTIIGLKTPDGSYTINPSADTKITQDCKFFVLGNPEQIQALNKLLNI
ncbi:MAG: potassium channel family protein [Flavobacteriales bacterium]